MLGKPYNKAQYRRRLLPLLGDRSQQSVEFKRANISAVLVSMHLPYIDGYKSRGNYQSLLATEVKAFLVQHPDFLSQMAQAPLVNPDKLPSMPVGAARDVFVEPPDHVGKPAEPAQPWVEPQGNLIDFTRRDAENRKLGRLGEKFVVELERRRLKEKGRDDLAKKVEWVSDTRGDGIGFDIRSFDGQDDSEWFVEVKATGLGKFFPFYVTANEVRCSEARPKQYHLYRVFDFSRSPRVYVLRGALSQVCRLEPMQFRAVI